MVRFSYSFLLSLPTDSIAKLRLDIPLGLFTGHDYVRRARKGSINAAMVRATGCDISISVTVYEQRCARLRPFSLPFANQPILRDHRINEKYRGTACLVVNERMLSLS